MKLAISRSLIDFGISEGYRSVERQNLLFRQKKSKIDGVNKKGKHNYSPSLAVDIYIYHPNRSTQKKIMYDAMHLSYVLGIVTSCAIELYDKGEIKSKIRWGGNWDSDGIIAYDHSFRDLPHIELI